MRAGAVAVSAVAFGWVVVQAQGGCGTEPAAPDPPPPEVAAPADANPQAERPSAAETPQPPPAPPTAAAPKEKNAAPETPAVYFSASKSGDFEFDDVASPGAGVGTSRPSAPAEKANNAGRKKPKAFFPASKSGLVREPKQQAPNAPATK